MEGTAISWLKFHTQYVFAYAFGQTEFPVPPAEFAPGERAGKFAGGLLGRALKCIMNRGRGGSWPCRRCAYDILMCKNGAPVTTKDAQQLAIDVHRATLTKLDGTRTPDEEKSFSQVKSMIDQICRKVFHRKVFHHLDSIPSIRACQEKGLKDGGGFGRLVRSFDSTHSYLPESDTLFGMVEIRGSVHECRFIDMSDRVASFQDHVDSLWVKCLDLPLSATPVPIPEPFKTRIITKGQAAEYFRCMEFQKLMHGALRREPIFQCIGHPIDDTDWVTCFKSRAELKTGEFFVSGDYQAATDNLNPRLSEYTWERICKYASFRGASLEFQDKYVRLGLKALTGHELNYKKHGKRYKVKQSWGQLMGSPMSFPILCIINAAATLVALDCNYGPNVPLRINGDDIAFIANNESYERWKSVTAVCGLFLSMGKNYTSREFLIMNSELRRSPEKMTWETHEPERLFPEENHTDYCPSLAPIEVPKPWKLEGFVNQSLLYNTVKKGMNAGKTKDVYWTDLSSIACEALRGIPTSHQMRLYGVFFKTYDSQIREAPVMCNKWFPKS